MGRSPIASEACNCSAPDTGNMEVLTMFGTAEQQDLWLRPLLDGEIRSAFAMTEPDVASSDATNISLRIERDGDDYVLNGRKWWTSDALPPALPGADRDGQDRPAGVARTASRARSSCRSDTPGLTFKRGLTVFGYIDQEGHAETVFDNVRVPADEPHRPGGRRLRDQPGPARPRPHPPLHAHHRGGRAGARADVPAGARSASTFGRRIAERANIQDWIAEARIELEMIRLLTLKTAWLMDTVGNKGARVEISAIKVAAPNVALKIIDRAIQVHGGGGMCQDFPLARDVRRHPHPALRRRPRRGAQDDHRPPRAAPLRPGLPAALIRLA